MRWITFSLALIACVAVGYAAYTLAGISWSAVVDYESPYADNMLPAARAASAEASLTVFVIIDGLRLDASQQMKSLETLRGYGTDLALTAPQTSLSYPNWTTLVSGAPPYISGVVTNWHEGEAPVETIFDTARTSGITSVFVGPEDFDQLYGVKEKASAVYLQKWDERYMSGEYVDAALELAETEKPQLLVLHLPDVDEAGHTFGGESQEYAQAVARVDSDLGRLISGLQSPSTAFVITADHGHIDTGGHGGWEPEVVTVPGVFAGARVPLAQGEASQTVVAPSVALLAGIAAPRTAVDVPAVVKDLDQGAVHWRNAADRLTEITRAFYPIVLPGESVPPQALAAGEDPRLIMKTAEQQRLALDREERLPYGAAIAVASLLALLLIGASSWRALVAALAGTLAYYAFYNVLFFGVHGYLWSLSAFNSEDKVQAFMNGRLLEAALAGLFGAAVAALVYPLLRTNPKRPHDQYLPGWLTLGPATMLATLATLGLQVGWFVWWWGIIPEWRLPDLKWGFKYDLDLLQATAIGFVAIVTPLVTYLVGRYHPKFRSRTAQGVAPDGDQRPS